MAGFAVTGELRYNEFLFDGVSHITIEEVIVADDGKAGDLVVDVELEE